MTIEPGFYRIPYLLERPEEVLDVEDALDRTSGAGRWFLYWDEDLTGHPIRGTITLAYGRDTLVIG